MQRCEDLANSVALQTRNALLNMQKRVATREQVIDLAQRMQAQFGGKDWLYNAVRNVLYPINSGDRFAIEGAANALSRLHLNALMTRLKDEPGLFRYARDQRNARAIAREIEQYDRASKGAKGNPGITGDRMAKSAAKAIVDTRESLRSLLNRNGAAINEYLGYIARTSHDPARMAKAGPERWTADQLKWVDGERTFGDAKPEEWAGILHDIYSSLVSKDGGGDIGFADPEFIGPANLAKRLSESRILHYRDADAFMDHMQAYGHGGSLMDWVYHSLDRGSRDAALMRTLGTNPKAEFDALIKYAGQHFKSSDPEAVGLLNDRQDEMRYSLAQLTGEANRPANYLASRILSYVRLDQMLSKMGQVLFTHFGVGATKQAVFRQAGIGSGLVNSLRSIVMLAQPEMRKQLAEAGLASLEGMQHDLIGRFGSNDSLPGMASKLAALNFKINGLAPFLAAQKTGTMFAAGRQLGMLAEKSYSELPENLRLTLREYHINAADWNTLRSAEHVQIGDRDFITARDAGDNEDLALKVHVMMNDLGDRSTVTPGVRTRTFAYMGTRPGTAPGEFMRSVMQFHSWILTAFNEINGSQMYRLGRQGGDWMGLAQYAALATVIGAGIIDLKDMVAGKKPSSPTDPKFWTRAFVQGGGGGIFADMLLGSNDSTDLTKTLAGAALGGGVGDAFNVFADLKAKALGDERQGKRLAPDAAKAALNNIPFQNLFYTRGAMNYLFGDSLREVASPGYLRRRQQAAARSGQQYWLSPSEHLQTFGR